ncbi:dipeptidase [Paraglaciecola arctica]|uniref:Peptidase M19, renal dipeptidase n=1 Tax=Paraglaciecola arctica BSs20135 TaxID=493475 RepID=K6ZDF5_9ALTE|nr:dipeptidase [Paraglaciecola arctica]GAC21450.1 peptidase M19, renal dipeptidase [Paraglaciecola arctica BSs20135]
MPSKKAIYKIIALIVILAVVGFFVFFPAQLDKQTNRLHDSTLPVISEQARTLHSQLFIGDWHSDTLMWKRDLMDKHDYGHVDIPRLQQGNVALQMFTTVTKSPDGINYEANSTDASDNITKLALVSLWPTNTWGSLAERALFQASKALELADEFPEQVSLITSKSELSQFLKQREANPKLLGMLLGTEGSHALDGELSNIQSLFDSGFRMMSLQHFFDNKLGGSLHGESGEGLTEFGKEALQKMQSLGIMVDVSHSSEQVVKDVLAISNQPLLVSHTGFYGHCPSARNIPDDLMQQIAANKGLIAVGYWDGAVCEPNVTEIAKAIKYGIELVGSEHIALGSDYDGATSVPFDTSQLIYLTQALLDLGLSEQQIKQVMGGNMLQYLQLHLPD